MITEITIKPTWDGAVNFPDHPMSHKWLDSLKGIELGASSHNSYHLPGSINIAPEDDWEFYRDDQVRVNGKYANIDLWGDATDLPLRDNSVQYVHSSHCFEHISNPILALLEANRVIKDGGYWMAIVPLPGAHAGDVGRELSLWGDWKAAYDFNWTPDNLPELVIKAAGGRRGHVFVYSPDTLKELIADAGREFGFNWELVDSEDRDVKVSNGFTLVYRVHKQPVTPNDELKMKLDLGLISNQTYAEQRYGIVYDHNTEAAKLLSQPATIAGVPTFAQPSDGYVVVQPDGSFITLTEDREQKRKAFEAVQEFQRQPEVVEVVQAEEITTIPDDLLQKLMSSPEALTKIKAALGVEVAPEEEKKPDVHFPSPDEFVDLTPRTRWIDQNGNL